MALIWSLGRCWDEGWPTGHIAAVSLALLAILLGTTLPGTERATGARSISWQRSFYPAGWKHLCLWRGLSIERIRETKLGNRGGVQMEENNSKVIVNHFRKMAMNLFSKYVAGICSSPL